MATFQKMTIAAFGSKRRRLADERTFNTKVAASKRAAVLERQGVKVLIVGITANPVTKRRPLFYMLVRRR